MQAATIALQASDVSGRRAVRVPSVPGDSTISELVSALLAKMGLARNDLDGRPVRYRARLEREARHLDGSERVGEALKPDDHVVLTPTIHAGGGE